MGEGRWVDGGLMGLSLSGLCGWGFDEGNGWDAGEEGLMRGRG